MTGADVSAPTAGLSALAGLRVVELGVWVAAPSAAALLADWGADVIKVEAPDRRSHAQRVRLARHRRATCPTRPSPSTTGASAAWSSTCATRRTADASRSCWTRPTSSSPTSGPTPSTRLGLEPAATVARHPRLVYCSISGYGLRGEDRNRPTYDIGAFWARSGLSMQMADGRGQPAERPGRHRRPHHRPGRPGRHPGRGARAAADRPGPGGRGVAAAHRRLRARVGPGPADDAGQGGPGRAPAPQPGPADEPLPGRRRALVLPHRLEADRHIGAVLPGARPARAARGSALLPTPPPSAGTGPRSSPSSTRSSPSARSTSGPSGSTPRGCGGRRPRPRPRWWRTRSCWRTTAFVEIDGGGGGGQRSVNGPVTFSDARPGAPGTGARAGPAHR